MEPEDLAVIGHVDDLLVDIYTANAVHIYILPQCSTPAAKLLNPTGMDAQSQRSKCAISGGILRYECILHEGYYKGKYSARFEDCAYCRYNIATPPNCLCTAKSGIQSISDFTCDPLELQERTDIIRKENDERRARKEAASKMVKSPRIQFHSYPANHSSENTASSPTDTELYEEQQRIAANFNPASPSWTVDRFGRRWIKCKECGSILRDTVMAYYGGPDGVNQGICSACSRKKH